MPIDQKRIVELAIANLEGEKSRIDAEIAELRTQLGAKKTAGTVAAKTTSGRAKSKFARTAAQKAKTSSTMKALWAKVYKAGFTNIKDYQASLKKG